MSLIPSRKTLFERYSRRYLFSSGQVWRRNESQSRLFLWKSIYNKTEELGSCSFFARTIVDLIEPIKSLPFYQISPYHSSHTRRSPLTQTRRQQSSTCSDMYIFMVFSYCILHKFIIYNYIYMSIYEKSTINNKILHNKKTLYNTRNHDMTVNYILIVSEYFHQ